MVHAAACNGLRALWIALVLSVVMMGPLGCISYEAEPLDPAAILRALESQLLNSSEHRTGADPTPPDEGLTPRQAIAFAVTHNPSLVARRAAEGVAMSQLVEAGLLQDPEIGFDFMDVVAAKIDGDRPVAADYVSGAGLSWGVPRPGEIGARTGIAQAHVDAVRQRILEAEWGLARLVQRAFIELLAAGARLDLSRNTITTARRTADFFSQALGVRAATAMQENLAAVELVALQQEHVRLEGQQRLALQRLNVLLGVPPQTALQLRSGENPFAVAPQVWDADVLVKKALDQRPDLGELLAEYRGSEEALRLEIARQWPGVSIGSGISIVVALFSRFNRPAIKTALKERERLGLEVRSAIHTLRSEVNLALEDLRRARLEVQFFEKNIDPRLKESLRLADEAFRARQLTLVEILTAQRQILDAGRTYLEARIKHAKARVMLDTITGSLFANEAREHGGESEEKK